MSDKKTAVKTEKAKAGSASPDEKRYAQFLLLERIRGCTHWTGSAALKAHVEENSSWADYGTIDLRLRTLDNWLRNLRQLSDETGLFHYREESDGYKYLSAKQIPITVESACMTLLAERFLKPLLPEKHIETGLEDMFTAARKRLQDHESKRGLNGDAIGSLLDRIAVLPRGQVLSGNEQATEFVAVVTGAILNQRCIHVRYNSRERLLHPYGIVFRDPKYYLLAVDDNAIREVGSDLSGLMPKTYLCSRFEYAEVSDASNRVPREFDIKPHLKDNPLGIPFPDAVFGHETRITLKLRLYGVDESVLLRDLKDHPIASDQQIHTDKESKSVATLIASDVYPSIELLHWLLARGDSVEVLEPEQLRTQVVNEAAAILARYTDTPSSDGQRIYGIK